LSHAPSRLRVAVVAADLAVRTRLASLVDQSGHELVELESGPDAILNDGVEGTALCAPIVAVGADEQEFPGLLPIDATAQQIDAALRAVAAGLTVRAPGPRKRFRSIDRGVGSVADAARSRGPPGVERRLEQ
jgi:hypothetical protein